MNLTEKPEMVNWPETHYVFVEKGGPFSENAQKAWMEFHATLPALGGAEILGMFSLYQLSPKAIYRAGASLKNAPKELPKGLQYEKVPGGKYAKFTLVGPYTQLPHACGRVFEIVEATRLPQRTAFFIENYVNNPATTPAEKLVTEILVPTL